MDKKLTLIGELINEIKKSRNDSYCLQNECVFQANILADDIIQRLINLRNLYSNIPLSTIKNEYYDTILMNSDIRQCLPHHDNTHTAQMVSIKAETIRNIDDPNLIKIAHHAFNNENYAKCVRTIERIAVLQQSKLNPILMDLCHKSYKKVIQSAVSNTDRLKLCEWWRLFAECTTMDDSSNEALLCQIDWRSECLQERLKLTRCVNERVRISELLIANLIEAYEVATQCMAKFSVTRLRQRIDGLCSMISDHLRNFSELNKVSLVVEEGIELLRLIYSEAKEEFDATIQNNNRSEDDKKNLMAVMNGINFVLQHCSWCDVSFIDNDEIKETNMTTGNNDTSRTIVQGSPSVNDLSSSDDLCHDDIIEARF